MHKNSKFSRKLLVTVSATDVKNAVLDYKSILLESLEILQTKPDINNINTYKYTHTYHVKPFLWFFCLILRYVIGLQHNYSLMECLNLVNYANYSYIITCYLK